MMEKNSTMDQFRMKLNCTQSVGIIEFISIIWSFVLHVICIDDFIDFEVRGADCVGMERFDEFVRAQSPHLIQSDPSRSTNSFNHTKQPGDSKKILYRFKFDFINFIFFANGSSIFTENYLKSSLRFDLCCTSILF